MGFDLNFIKCPMCFQSLFIFFFWRGGGGGGGGGGLLGLSYSLNIHCNSQRLVEWDTPSQVASVQKSRSAKLLSKSIVIPNGCHKSWIHFLFFNLIWAATGIASFFFLIILLILKYRKQFIWCFPLFLSLNKTIILVFRRSLLDTTQFL
jgi:hypothetical protein